MLSIRVNADRTSAVRCVTRVSLALQLAFHSGNADISFFFVPARREIYAGARPPSISTILFDDLLNRVRQRTHRLPIASSKRIKPSTKPRARACARPSPVGVYDTCADTSPTYVIAVGRSAGEVVARS